MSVDYYSDEDEPGEENRPLKKQILEAFQRNLVK